MRTQSSLPLNNTEIVIFFSVVLIYKFTTLDVGESHNYTRKYPIGFVFLSPDCVDLIVFLRFRGPQLSTFSGLTLLGPGGQARNTTHER